MKNILPKSERTRRYIIEQTANIFNQKGYIGTSLSDLTEATGLTKGSIYGNFTNKEEVALACFDYNLGQVNEAVQRQMAKVTTFEEKLLAYTQVYHSFLEISLPVGGCPILNTAIEADDTNLLLKDRAAKAVLTWKNRIMDIIEQGIAAGEFKDGVLTEQIALSIIALIEGGTMIARITDNAASLDKILQTVQLLVTQLKR